MASIISTGLQNESQEYIGELSQWSLRAHLCSITQPLPQLPAMNMKIGKSVIQSCWLSDSIRLGCIQQNWKFFTARKEIPVFSRHWTLYLKRNVFVHVLPRGLCSSETLLERKLEGLRDTTCRNAWRTMQHSSISFHHLFYVSSFQYDIQRF